MIQASDVELRAGARLLLEGGITSSFMAPTMIQLLLGIDPEPLGVAPFILASRSYPGLMATDIGLDVHPFARVVVLPALGAYVGGDIIAGALASGMDRDKRLRLFIDVGTNCEIVIGDGERMMATAAPAGPAFEAASIRNGMRAAPGARLAMARSSAAE